MTKMKLTITKRALFLLYFSCYLAALFFACSLVELLGIPEHLRIWSRSCGSLLVLISYLFVTNKNWLPPISSLFEAERKAIRIGEISVDVIPANAKFAIWKGIVLAGVLIIWGGIILIVMELSWHSGLMGSVITLLMGATLAMIVDYVEKKSSRGVP
jgi:hypothetical protein